MKLLKIVPIFICAFILVSCSVAEPEIKDSIMDNTEDQTGTILTSEYDSSLTEHTERLEQDTTVPADNVEVTTTADPRNEDRNYGGSFGIADGILPAEYNGEEISVTMEIFNDGNGQAYDQAFIIFVNGERNDYSTDRSDEKKPYHVNYVPEGGTVQITLYFTPYNCKKGDTAVIYIGSMLTPEYMLPDTSYTFFGPHHNISSLLPFALEINEDTPVTEEHKFFSDFETSEVTEEFEQQHTQQNALGNVTNYLDRANFVMYKQKENESIITAGNKLILNMSAFGSYCSENEIKGKYLVGIYINHELQKAFGDSYYALCSLDRDHIYNFTAEIDTSTLSGLNHIYMIAVPCELSAVDLKMDIYQSPSRILEIE